MWKWVFIIKGVGNQFTERQHLLCLFVVAAAIFNWYKSKRLCFNSAINSIALPSTKHLPEM